MLLALAQAAASITLSYLTTSAQLILTCATETRT
eukprot:XP_001709534.1 Hypothetical protein GL50803_27882 [Giardia lamblia ATCC 50803]